MTTIRIVLDTPAVSKSEVHELAQFARKVLPDFCNYWEIPLPKIEISTAQGPAGTINVYLTETNRKDGALGWHGREGGYQAAWISPAAHGVIESNVIGHVFALFGGYIPAMPPAMKEPILIKGLANSLIEEIMELLIDPDPGAAIADPASHPEVLALDSNGDLWLIEVNDHASSGHFVMRVETRVLRGLKIVKVSRFMVGPDATLKSFYRLSGKAPFTLVQLWLQQKSKIIIAGVPAKITKPFGFKAGAYGYRIGQAGGTMSFFARAGD